MIEDRSCKTCGIENSDEYTVFLPEQSRFFLKFFPADPDFAADMIWMKTAYYYGLSSQSASKDFFFLPPLLKIITELSPQWKFPYYFGSVILLFEADMKAAGFRLIDKGTRELPDFWELSMFKGMYFLMKENDYQNAAMMIAQASKQKGAPSYLALLSTTLALKAGRTDLAEKIVENLVVNIKDKTLVEMLKRKLHEKIRH